VKIASTPVESWVAITIGNIRRISWPAMLKYCLDGIVPLIMHVLFPKSPNGIAQSKSFKTLKNFRGLTAAKERPLPN